MWRVLTITLSLNKNNPIGFFDSGVGGLTVLSEFRKVLPSEDCIYFGDTRNMPYGEKTKEQLIDFSRKIFDFFKEKNVKAVVMACNTTSAMVYEDLKDEYPFKLYPVIQSVTKVLAGLPVKKIGIFATPATISSKAYSTGINSFNNNINVIEIPCPSWVKIVENKEENTNYAFKEIKVKLDEMLKFNPEKIVLGCTHYPYLLEQLSKFAPQELFINPAEAFVDYIKKDLSAANMLTDRNSKGKDIFYVSSSPQDFCAAAGMFYKIQSTVFLK